MTLLVHEFIDTEARESRAHTTSHDEAADAPQTAGPTVAALVARTVLLVLAIAVNIATAPVLAGLLTIALVASTIWSAEMLDPRKYTAAE